MESDRASLVALGVGVASLIAAGVVALLRRTRDLPLVPRLGLMVRLAISAVRGVLPARDDVACAAAGLLALAGTLAAGLALSLLVAWLIVPTRTQPTEANETFGDAVAVYFVMGIGALVSLVGAIFVGLAASDLVTLRCGCGNPAEVDAKR